MSPAMQILNRAWLQLSDQSQNNLMMSSPVITTNSTLLVGDNYLGYQSMGTENINGIDSPVEITRLASRIDLVSLKTSFTKRRIDEPYCSDR